MQDTETIFILKAYQDLTESQHAHIQADPYAQTYGDNNLYLVPTKITTEDLHELEAIEDILRKPQIRQPFEYSVDQAQAAANSASAKYVFGFITILGTAAGGCFSLYKQFQPSPEPLFSPKQQTGVSTTLLLFASAMVLFCRNRWQELQQAKGMVVDERTKAKHHRQELGEEITHRLSKLASHI